MNTPWSRAYLFAVLASVAVLVMAACTPSELAQVQGILQNVDSLSGEVTVKLKDGGTMTFNLKDVNVEALRKAAGSASLESGGRVTIEVDENKKAKRMKTHTAEVEGVIKRLDPDKKTVTIMSEDDEEITLQVTETTRIEAEENRADFSALRVGQEIEAKYDTEAKAALRIEAEEDEDEVEGTVTAVDSAAKTVRIRAQNGVEETFKVVSGTRLKLNGAATLADLKAGMQVEADFNPATKELSKLKVEDGKKGKAEEPKQSKIEGTITAVDSAAKTITIRARNGIESALKVTPGTRLKLDGAGTFENLKAGMQVEADFNPATKELRKLELED